MTNSTTLSTMANTMSSLELVVLINKVRKEENPDSAELKHYTFMEKVVKVLGETHQNFLGGYFDSNNQERPCYYLPKRESILMVMSESYKVQAAIYDRMEELEQVAKEVLIKDAKDDALLAKLDAQIEASKAKIGLSRLKVQTAKEQAQLKLQALKDKLAEQSKVLRAKTTELLAQGAKVKGDMTASKLELPVDTITNLLKAHGSKLKPSEANNALVNLGYLQPSRSEVTVKGSYYGRTVVSSKSAHTTLARWFPAEFEALLKEVDQYYADRASGLD